MQLVAAGESTLVPKYQDSSGLAIRRNEWPENKSIDLYRRLATADLPASAFRLISDILARLVADGRTSECVTTQWLADRLGLHRNAITAAFQALENAGLIRRTAVKKRGAPTRTTLIGPAAALIEKGALIRPESRSDSSPPSTKKEIAVAVPQTDGGRPRSAEAPKQPQALIRPESSYTERPTSVTRVDPMAQLARANRIPEEAKRAAMEYRGDPATFPIEAAWHLDEQDRVFIRNLIPRREPTVPSTNTSPRAIPRGETAPAAIASSLWMHLERLSFLTRCPKRAAAVLDEIAFSVLARNLGRGDTQAGIRAGLSMVARGQWRTPKGFQSHWYGAVARGVQTHSSSSVAQETVH